MNMVRKIIESTYDGRCTVTQRAECEKPNGSTGFTNTVILENEPCRLSFNSKESTEEGDRASIQTQTVKLFLKPEKIIEPGSKIRGTVDTIEAMKQVVYKILCTERYVYPIYSWNYGIELVDLFGESVTYACPEITRRIEEALLQDERINSVDQFEFDTSKKHEVVCTFSVHTIFGDFQMEKEVSI